MVTISIFSLLGDLLENGKWTGDHFNPKGASIHGGLKGSPRHAGDLGNIEADTSGYAYFNFGVDGLSIIEKDSPECIIGRGLMIH